jgi:hypothetical protein
MTTEHNPADNKTDIPTEQPHKDQIGGWSQSAFQGATQAIIATQITKETGRPPTFEEVSDPEVMRAYTERFINPQGH